MIISTFVNGDALICAIPSKSENGLYLIEVKPSGDTLMVTHYCPANKFKNECSHIQEAVACFYRWKWWLPQKEVVQRTSQIILQREWLQIPVPGSLEDVLRDVLRGEIREIRTA
jgi:hypothetical protein